MWKGKSRSSILTFFQVFFSLWRGRTAHGKICIYISPFTELTQSSCAVCIHPAPLIFPLCSWVKWILEENFSLRQIPSAQKWTRSVTSTENEIALLVQAGSPHLNLMLIHKQKTSYRKKKKKNKINSTTNPKLFILKLSISGQPQAQSREQIFAVPFERRRAFIAWENFLLLALESSPGCAGWPQLPALAVPAGERLLRTRLAFLISRCLRQPLWALSQEPESMFNPSLWIYSSCLPLLLTQPWFCAHLQSCWQRDTKEPSENFLVAAWAKVKLLLCPFRSCTGQSCCTLLGSALLLGKNSLAAASLA